MFPTRYILYNRSQVCAQSATRGVESSTCDVAFFCSPNVQIDPCAVPFVRLRLAKVQYWLVSRTAVQKPGASRRSGKDGREGDVWHTVGLILAPNRFFQK